MKPQRGWFGRKGQRVSGSKGQAGGAATTATGLVPRAYSTGAIPARMAKRTRPARVSMRSFIMIRAR